MSISEWGLSDKLVRTTVKVETLSGGNLVGHGTGFLFDFSKHDDIRMPAIVTNKHVIENCDSVKMTFNMFHDGILKNDVVEIGDLDKIAIPHPEADIDITAIPIAALDPAFESLGDTYAHAFAGLSDIVRKDEESGFKSIETATMVGYPLNIYDSVNNMPVTRRGITATPIEFDYMGRPEFLLDLVSLPGSSGSPVYIHFDGFRSDRAGNITIGQHSAILAGISYRTVEVIDPVIDNGTPTHMRSKSSAGIARVIKSRKLLELASEFERRNFQ